MNTKEKLKKLKDILREMGSAVVAFSGGVDSSLLLKIAKEVLGNRVVAATAVSYHYPSWEINEADAFANGLGVEHTKIKIDPLRDIPGFRSNPYDRCYICKRAIFSKLMEYAENQGIGYVLDGTNADDLGDYRPGLRAINELGVKSPLLMAGLTKMEIRQIAREMGLEIYNKPAFACLVTRIPYNEEVSVDKLSMIDKAEIYIMSKGIRNVRVRCHESLARIEVDRGELPAFFDVAFMSEVEDKLKSFGFKYVSLDLGGYKTGNMNQEVNNG